MKRKILSLILVFAMTVSLFTVGTGAVEPTYGDTAGHWAESSIERWSGHGIVQGSSGEFDPNGQLTCAQLATILAKLLKLPTAKDAGFTDNTADAWYYDAINRCAAAGILNGNGDGTVTPEAPITRERAMVMLARALGIEPIRKPDLTKYTDAAQVSAYAQGYVAALIEAGIVGGVTADELAPQANINRASTVTILDRAISTYADKAGATVKADGKGIVLVVAENVKITNAPEGTKIVVADGATGLTVNGKAVSDDQTYIVPKTTTGSGSSSGGYSHSHSYNATTHKCSCGEFDPAVVATIGNTNGYLTLKEAVAAVPTNNTATTIKLLKNTSGDGIDVNANQNIIFDFGGHTYTLQGRMVGSAGTETNGFRFLQGATVTLKNGSLLNGNTVSEDFLTNTPAKVMVNSYANLVLDDFSINASTTGVQREGSGAYGTAALYITSGPAHVKGSGSYTARDGQYAIYMANVAGYTAGADLYFDEDFTGTVRGKVTSGNQQTAAIIIKNGNYDFGEITLGTSTMIITGGTFSTEPDDSYIAAGYEAKDNGNNTWTVSEKTGVTLVAQVGVNKYESLADALAAAKSGDTVKLVQDITPTGRIVVTGNKNITIDLAEKKITSKADVAIVNDGTGKLTITGNGTVDTSLSTNDENIAIWARTGSIDIENGTFINKSNKEATVYVGTSESANEPVITIKGGTFKNSAEGTYTYNSILKPLTLNVQNGKPVTSIVINGGTFYGNDPKNGDDNLGGTFLAPDYKSVETSAGSGIWTVSKMTWDEYPEDASVVPSGLVIQEYPQNEFDSSNGKTGTITIKDKDALLYFAYRLDLAKAYAECGEKAHGTGWGHTCIWYGGAYARHIVLDANIDLGGMTLENGFGNMKDFAFDGHNHKISNVTINYTGTGNTGLFVGGNRGISNLVVENVNVIAPNGTENAVGIVSSDANADITNVTVRNSSVTGGKFTGAIVGYNYGSVKDCKVENCTVSGRYKVGGIIGYICNSNDVPTYVTGNDLTGVTVKGEKLVAGKDDFVIGKIVGNWNATIGECSSNTFTAGTTDAAEDIGEIESRCIVTVNGVTQLPQNAAPETINNVITNSKDAEGNVVKDVKLALPSDSAFELNNGLAHEGDKSRKVTIVGDGTQTVDVITKAVSAENGQLNYQRGSTFTFENVKVENGTGTYDGIVCDELIYRNCIIKGVTTLYGKATFINCTFENTMADQYSIWTWGGTDVKFEGCTFNTNGKAILLFGEEKTTKLTVTGCRFNDRNNGTAGKAAIEIGEANYGKHNNFTVVISDSEVVTGFAINSAGTNTGSKLWANKNSMGPEHLSVTIDGTKVL